jgi:primosomal protein N'
MKIKQINTQHRRDFWADMECEHCGHVVKNVSGYDDAYFHKEVIPNMKCKKCGKIADEHYRPLTTKYPEDQIV